MKRNIHSPSRYLWAIFLGLFAFGFTVQVDAAKPKTEEQQLKHDNRYKGLVEKQIQKIQKYLDKGSVKSAKKYVQQAEKYIGKISDGFMAGAEGSALRSKLDDVTKQVNGGLSGSSNAKDEKYRGFVEKRIQEIKKYLDMNSLASAERNVKQAEIYIGKISDGFMAGPEGIALRSKLDDITKLVGDRVSGAQAASANADAILQEKINYGPSVRKYANTYYLLNAGKNKSAGDYSYGFDHIETLKNGLPEFLAYESEFRKNFPNLIQGAPDYNYDGIVAGNVLDLIKNAKEYQANFTEVVGNRLLDNTFDQCDDIVSEFTAHNMIPSPWLDDLYGSKTTNDYLDMDKKLKPSYDAVSRPLPMDRLQKLATYKPKIRKMVESAAKKLSWDGKTYKVQNGDMENVAEHYAEKKGWKLVEYGSTDEVYLKKNGLGIPLHKQYRGMIVVRTGQEPFNRAYHVDFYDHFDGNGYPGISELQFTSRAIPFAR